MKIVIVEGDASVRKEIESILDRLSLDLETVGVATDGKTGYSLILQTQPDLVLMDTTLAGMSGLSMLRKLRSMQIASKVIVLTESEAFHQARKAIELGVDGYLVKPLRKSQLCRAVMHIWERQSEQRNIEKVFGLDSIFRSCLNGQLHPDEEFHRMTREKYGFTVEDPAAVCAVWLEEGYEQQKESLQKMLIRSEKMITGAACHVMQADAWKLVLVIVYRSYCPENYYNVFQREIIPSVCGSIKGDVVCLWMEMEHISGLLDAMREIQKVREWNLLFDRGDLIRCRDIEKIETLPIKYPAELEVRVRQAVLAADAQEIRKCYYSLYDMFRSRLYRPEDIKEVLIRFNIGILAAYKTQREVVSELQVQECMYCISNAMTWGQIRGAMERFLQLINPGTFEEPGDEQLSSLVRKALQLVRKYYDQGITLEETADRLFVSKEYLSTQFKKETGGGFAETVRKYRVERIKELLLGTRLKIRQIAELSGYSDPKYMSKVFKEEVGMLPTEFRKSAH